jgi:hypothetical protein
MTIAKDKEVIAGEDLTDKGRDKLHTDDIAGMPKPDSHEISDLKPKEARPNGERGDSKPEPLFADDVDKDFRHRWRDIQSGFVDQPRAAVEQADELVAQVMQRLAQSFSEQRSNLEKQWEASDKVSTEDLRVALTRYRSFFERLLSV